MTRCRQWINAERTVLVVERADGTITVATRPETDDLWGPPTLVEPDPTIDTWCDREVSP